MEWLRWQRPTLHTAEEGSEARVTSVDLFYDLVFAVVVAQLATSLAADISLRGLLTFAALLIPAVRVWIGQTLYSDRFEALDVSYRLIIFAATFIAGGLAVSAPGGFGVTFPLFVLSLVAARGLLVGSWLRAGLNVPEVRPLAHRYLVFYSIISAFWILAVPAQGLLRYAFVVVAIAAEFVLPLTTAPMQNRLGRFSQEHLTDRFGAFFLIVLGQLVLIAILVMTRMRLPSFADMTAGALSFVLSFVLWWIYVDHVVGRPLRQGTWSYAVWVTLHVPLFMATAAFGSGVLTFVTRGEAVVPDPARWLMCGALGVVILFTGTAELALVPLSHGVRRVVVISMIHVVPALLVVPVAVFGRGLTAIPLLLVLLAIGLLSLLIGEAVRARGQEPSPE
jgi:low temperature requirement protein LtrA